jgi:transposase, IS6 family
VSNVDAGPELDKCRRRHLKPINRRWRVDETCIKVKGKERFLYRTVDSSGQTIDFLQRGLKNTGNSKPRVIAVDRNRSYPGRGRRVEEGRYHSTTRLANG